MAVAATAWNMVDGSGARILLCIRAVGATRLDMAVTANHRARIYVNRLLRGDEVATLIGEVLASLRANERERAIIGAWGDLLLESTSDGSIDLFGLGTVAYRLLAGSLPQPNTRYIPGAPPPLAALIVQMLSPDAKARPTLDQAELALAEMLGRKTPPPMDVEVPLELIDDFADDGATEISPTTGLLRKPKWTPPTHLAPLKPESPLPASPLRPLTKKP